MTAIPFNRAHITGREMEYLAQAIAGGHLSGDGPFTKRCHTLLEQSTGAHRALLVHSGTAALEMAALLADIGPGDEVIMPSYTFVSTANAVVLRGGVPVFVDVREETLNLDERLVEGAIGPRTRAIMAVHYAGVGCRMDDLLRIARAHDLALIEDAAQAVGARWRGQPLGAIGDLGCLSFHETKNVVSGEGGALLLRDERFVERAEIIREKGTNRSRFWRGLVDKYTWVDVGSSYLPGELTAAFLLAQLEHQEDLNRRRLAIWAAYHDALAAAEREGRLRRPIVPEDCEHNGHLYYVLLGSAEERDRVIARLKARGIGAVFHYVPLHSSPAGRRFGRAHGDGLLVTDRAADTLLRLPIYPGMAEQQAEVIDVLLDALR